MRFESRHGVAAAPRGVSSGSPPIECGLSTNLKQALYGAQNGMLAHAVRDFLVPFRLLSFRNWLAAKRLIAFSFRCFVATVISDTPHCSFDLPMVWHDRSAAANMVEKNYYPSCAWWVCCPSCFPASSATGAFSILTAALLVFCWSIGSIRDIKHNKNWSRRAFSRKCGVLLQGECDDQLPSMSSDTPCWGLFFVSMYARHRA